MEPTSDITVAPIAAAWPPTLSLFPYRTALLIRINLCSRYVLLEMGRKDLVERVSEGGREYRDGLYDCLEVAWIPPGSLWLQGCKFTQPLTYLIVQLC